MKKKKKQTNKQKQNSFKFTYWSPMTNEISIIYADTYVREGDSVGHIHSITENKAK